MIAAILHPRVLESTDWTTFLFVLTLVLIAVCKSLFEPRFAEFMRLIVSDKYLKVYRDPAHLWSGFTLLLFAIQMLSFAFFIQLLGSQYGYTTKTDGLVYIQIITYLSVFVLAKFLVDKIIGTAFSMEEFADQFNLQKASYRSYIAMLLFPINVVLYYNSAVPNFVFNALIFVILAINLFTYLASLKNYQNLLAGKLFYFILYLCALEIAPYYFLYYWFTKR
ncbi:MAG: hypothetical protein RIT03_1155 [Bacteroidota bacterium]|jgi:hypothetical protein